jgi:hypothetical protein
MSFTIDGATQTVYACQDCSWCQIERHFVSDGDSLICTLCGGSAEIVDEIQPSVGMSDFKYRNLLSILEEETPGVGPATIEHIEQHFDDGDDFLDAVEDAFRELDYDGLTAVDNIGSATAREIAITIGAEEDWDGGAIVGL